MFERLKRLWRQTVAWFHPRDRGSVPAPVFTHYSPPPSGAIRALSAGIAVPHTEQIEDRLAAAEAKLGLPPAPELTSDDRLARAEQSASRRQRRRRAALERARRKHDKFVTPQGPEPTHYSHEHDDEDDHPAEPPVTKHEEPLPDGPIHDDPNDRIIAGEWLKGDGEEVLYEESEFYGEFNFRDTILEQLDRYWVYLARMRKYDPDAYGFYKEMGATLLPYANTESFSDKPEPVKKVKNVEKYKRNITLTPYFKQTWPAFGCCAFGTNPRDEKAESLPTEGGYVNRPKVSLLPQD